MNNAHLDLLQTIRKNCILSKGEIVFHPGQPAEAIFRIIKGEVHLYRHDQDGKRALLYRAYDNDFFAEASLNSKKYHCTAVCVKPTELDVFNSNKMLGLLCDNSSFATAWISLLSSELRRQRASVERLNIKSAKERIRHYLMTEGDSWGEVCLKGTLTEFAELLGLTRETLYRTISNMEKQGELERIGNIIKLKSNL